MSDWGRWPYYEEDPKAYTRVMQNYYSFLIDGVAKPIGLVHSKIVRKMPWPDCRTIDKEKRQLILHGANDSRLGAKLLQRPCGGAIRWRYRQVFEFSTTSALLSTQPRETTIQMSMDVPLKLLGRGLTQYISQPGRIPPKAADTEHKNAVSTKLFFPSD